MGDGRQRSGDRSQNERRKKGTKRYEKPDAHPGHLPSWQLCSSPAASGLGKGFTQHHSVTLSTGQYHLIVLEPAAEQGARIPPLASFCLLYNSFMTSCHFARIGCAKFLMRGRGRTTQTQPEGSIFRLGLSSTRSWP